MKPQTSAQSPGIAQGHRAASRWACPFARPAEAQRWRKVPDQGRRAASKARHEWSTTPDPQAESGAPRPGSDVVWTVGWEVQVWPSSSHQLL